MTAGPAAPEDKGQARERALKLLARREHAPVELAAKLRQRGFEAGAVDAVIAKLIEADLLSAARYAEALARTRARNGNGPVRIRAELATKSIADADIDAALAEADTDWHRAAVEARRKRFGPEPPPDFPAKAKQTRFLQRRGFTAEQIASVFHEATTS